MTGTAGTYSKRTENPASSTQRVGSSAKRAVVVMYAGLALTVIAVLAVMIGDGSINRHFHEVYDPYIGAAKADEDKGPLVTYLYMVGGIGVISWLWMVWAVKRAKRWARGVATIVFLLATVDALVNLLMQEYHKTILPTSIGLAGVLPCVAGLVAIVLLWTRDRVAPSA